MTTPRPTVEEDRAAREAYAEKLHALGFAGPRKLGESGFLGLGSHEGAVCLTCGSLVLLGDPEDTDHGPIERGIRLHVEYHARQDATS